MKSTAHLLEIDLLRGGRRAPMCEPLPAAPYFVLLGRANRRPVTEVWPIQLPEALPRVPVPLLAGDADARLDLQAALSNVYDVFGYRFALDYTHPPPLPLMTESELAWIKSRLA